MNTEQFFNLLPWLVPVALLVIVLGVKVLLDFLFD